MRHEFEIDGKRVRAEAEWVRGVLWIHFDGRSFPYESEKDQKSKRRGGGGTGKAGDILSPMPGKITKVLVKAGDQVDRGAVVLVMEAMKMEYTLKSEGPGTVEAVSCQVGDQVTLGKMLVKVKPVASEPGAE